MNMALSYDKIMVLIQKFTMLFLNENFQRDIIKLRPTKTNLKINREKIETELKKILPKYNISIAHLKTIRNTIEWQNKQKDYYLLFAVTQAGDSGVEIIEGNKISPKAKHRLFIEVFPETTIKDIQSNLKKINEAKINFFNIKKIRQKEYRYFYRDVKIFKLYIQSKKYKEIANIINKEYGTRLMYFEIAKIISRFKQKIRDI